MKRSPIQNKQNMFESSDLSGGKTEGFDTS